jgi:hypothetical protein
MQCCSTISNNEDEKARVGRPRFVEFEVRKRRDFESELSNHEALLLLGAS